MFLSLPFMMLSQNIFSSWVGYRGASGSSGASIGFPVLGSIPPVILSSNVAFHSSSRINRPSSRRLGGVWGDSRMDRWVKALGPNTSVKSSFVSCNSIFASALGSGSFLIFGSLGLLCCMLVNSISIRGLIPTSVIMDIIRGMLSSSKQFFRSYSKISDDFIAFVRMSFQAVRVPRPFMNPCWCFEM